MLKLWSGIEFIFWKNYELHLKVNSTIEIDNAIKTISMLSKVDHPVFRECRYPIEQSLEIWKTFEENNEIYCVCNRTYKQISSFIKHLKNRYHPSGKSCFSEFFACGRITQRTCVLELLDIISVYMKIVGKKRRNTKYWANAKRRKIQQASAADESNIESEDQNIAEVVQLEGKDEKEKEQIHEHQDHSENIDVHNEEYFEQCNQEIIEAAKTFIGQAQYNNIKNLFTLVATMRQSFCKYYFNFLVSFQ